MPVRRAAPPPSTPLDDLLPRFIASCRSLGVADGEGVILAVSGGPDSVALLHLAARARPETGWRLSVAHLDHALRSESAADARFVVRMARGLGLTTTVRRTDVGALAAERGEGLEEAGRTARYELLADCLAEAGPDAVAMTAHTLDDQAETVLLHLARGSGLTGLAGIAERRGRVVRPLLGVRRSDLRAALDAAAIPYRIDPSNAERLFARNRARADLLPLLEALHPGAAPGIARAARLAGADDAFLTDLAETWLAAHRDPDGWLDWREPPPGAIAARVLRLAIGPPAPSEERISALAAAATGPGGRVVELGRGRSATLRRHRLRIDRPEEMPRA
jgi:tRNA(Ile)-lysidine synthase